jgi:hypothetical protein
VYGSCFLPLMLVWSLPGCPSHLFWDLHRMWGCSFVRSSVKLHRARHTTKKKNDVKSAHAPSCMKFCSLTPKIRQYSETCIRWNLNKVEICSMWTNSIVPARRISVIYFV